MRQVEVRSWRDPNRVSAAVDRGSLYESPVNRRAITRPIPCPIINHYGAALPHTYEYAYVTHPPLTRLQRTLLRRPLNTMVNEMRIRLYARV